MDTPASDPSLSAAEVAQITGGTVWQDVGSDPAGAPWKNGTSPDLFVFQDTDGTKLPAEATFDNLELRTHEVPQVGIERAVRLIWPATGLNYAVEGAPTVQGPWLPVQESDIPGVQTMTLPLSGPAQFFRLQQAP